MTSIRFRAGRGHRCEMNSADELQLTVTASRAGLAPPSWCVVNLLYYTRNAAVWAALRGGLIAGVTMSLRPYCYCPLGHSPRRWRSDSRLTAPRRKRRQPSHRRRPDTRLLVIASPGKTILDSRHQGFKIFLGKRFEGQFGNRFEMISMKSTAKRGCFLAS